MDCCHDPPGRPLGSIVKFNCVSTIHPSPAGQQAWLAQNEKPAPNGSGSDVSRGR